METSVGVQCIGCGKPASAILECGYCKQTIVLVGFKGEGNLPDDKQVLIGSVGIASERMVPTLYEAEKLISALRCVHCGNPLSHIVCCAYCGHGWMNNWDCSNTAGQPIAHIGKFNINHWTLKPLQAMM